ncbi:MAG: MATE family efflux transporter [Deltaproteobacteria bacterium]|nr:MATE family efflux transporter [Deltaproteobacteria bacterium]
MLAQAGQPILNIAETAMIGRLGATELAARAIGAALAASIYWVFAFLTFGSTTLIGHHFGARDYRACGQTYLHALLVALVGGLAVAGAGVAFAEPLYRLLGAEAAVVERGAGYFRIYIAGAPLTLIVYSSIGFFRGVQNTRTPLAIAFVITAIQLLLDFGLIYGNFGLPALGLYGAALAACSAQFCGAAIYLALFFKSPLTTDYRAGSWRPSISGLKPLFRIGQDLAIRTGALRLSLVFATSTAARMGAATLAAYEVVFQLFMLGSDLIDGLAIAGQALTAKYLGSQERRRAYRMGVTLLFCGGLAGAGFALGFAAAWSAIVAFFTTSREVISLLDHSAMLLVCALQPFNGMVFVLDGLLIGARDTRYLMWAMLAGAMILIAIAWSALQLAWGLTGILSAVAALMAWRSATNLLRFFRQTWAI